MKWYKFPLDQYRKLSVELPDAEDLAFRRMIDLYYTIEGPLPVEEQALVEAIRLDYDCIEPVLHGFFERTDNGWRNDYLQADINTRKSRSEKNRASGKRGGRPRREQ